MVDFTSIFELDLFERKRKKRGENSLNRPFVKQYKHHVDRSVGNIEKKKIQMLNNIFERENSHQSDHNNYVSNEPIEDIHNWLFYIEKSQDTIWFSSRMNLPVTICW